MVVHAGVKGHAEVAWVAMVFLLVAEYQSGGLVGLAVWHNIEVALFQVAREEFCLYYLPVFIELRQLDSLRCLLKAGLVLVFLICTHFEGFEPFA